MQNVIKEASKGECIIMGDFNGNLKRAQGVFLFLIQETFLTQHVLEPTNGENVLDVCIHKMN